MAPSESSGGADKYNNMPLEKLEEECEMRGIEFEEDSSEDDLRSLLIKHDNKGPDWADIFSELMCHFNVDYFKIPYMTIPVINTIRGKLGKNIALTMPSFFGGTSPTNKNTDTSTQEDVDAFFGDF